MVDRSRPLPVLVVVDVQNGFVGPYTKHVPPAIAAYLDKRRERFAAVIATKFRNPPGSSFEELIDWQRLRDSPEVDLAPEIVECVDTIVDKTCYGAVDELAEILRNYRTTDVYLCGIDTDVCVLQNAAGLFDKGFTPRVIYSLCATNGGDDAHRAAYPLLCRTIGSRQVLLDADPPI